MLVTSGITTCVGNCSAFASALTATRTMTAQTRRPEAIYVKLRCATVYFSSNQVKYAWPTGAREEAREYLNRAINESSQWRPQAIENEGGLDSWMSRMEETIDQPDRVKEVVAEEIVKHRLEKIPLIELIV